jgi:hypothetical protein
MKLTWRSVQLALGRPEFGWIRSKNSIPFALALVALVFPISASATFGQTGSLIGPRSGHAAVLLPNGQVLVTGGFGPIGGGYTAFLPTAELYDPGTGSFASTGTMTDGRENSTATLLQNGKVLVAGGYGGIGFSNIASAELYDPATGSFAPTGAMTVSRAEATATLLPNGKVLIAGGISGGYSFIPTASAELYDPSSGTFAPTGSMAVPRFAHSATLLPNGDVLIAGGDTALGTFGTATAELYDPTSGTFSPTGSMSVSRWRHTATVLPNGKVLVAGGFGAGADARTSAELYDPTSGTFSPTGAMTTARETQTATLLANGQVLIAGGENTDSGSYSPLASAELYDPVTGLFTSAGDMTTARRGHTATLLPNGDVLLAGGSDSDSEGTAELFTQRIPFSTFSVNLTISPGQKGKPDKFDLSGTFALGAGNNGINPVVDDVTLSIGTITATIPAGVFVADAKGGAHYSGTASGLTLAVNITPKSGGGYRIAANGSGNLNGIARPVNVLLIIGDDKGTTTA